MNYVTRLSLCLLVPAFLPAADLPEMEGMLANLTIAEKSESESVHKNMHNLLMNRQLDGRFPQARRKAVMDQEKKDVLKKADQYQRSHVPISFEDSRFEDGRRSFFLAIQRITLSCGGRVMVALPVCMSLAMRMVQEGKNDEGGLRLYSRIDGIDKPVASALMAVRYNDTTGQGSFAMGELLPWSDDMPEVTRSVTFAVVNGLLLNTTGIDEVDCNQLKRIFPSLKFVTLSRSAPEKAKQNNAHNSGGVEIIYGLERMGYDEGAYNRIAAYPFTPEDTLAENEEFKSMMGAFDRLESQIPPFPENGASSLL